MDYGSVESYELWLEASLEETHARAREIQLQLDGIRRWRAGQPGSPNIEPSSHQEERTVADDANPTDATKQTRVSKNQPIFDAFKAAGSQGLSQKEVLQVATKHGLLTNPNAIRALCWNAKQAGRLSSIAPGRYAIAPKNEAAAQNSPEGEAAASTDHNQHREGDAGGGT